MFFLEFLFFLSKKIFKELLGSILAAMALIYIASLFSFFWVSLPIIIITECNELWAWVLYIVYMLPVVFMGFVWVINKHDQFIKQKGFIKTLDDL